MTLIYTNMTHPQTIAYRFLEHGWDQSDPELTSSNYAEVRRIYNYLIRNEYY